MEFTSDFNNKSLIHTVKLSGPVTPADIAPLVEAIHRGLSRRSNSNVLVDVKDSQVDKTERPGVAKALDFATQLLPAVIPEYTKIAIVVPDQEHRIAFAEQVVGALQINGIMSSYFLNLDKAVRWLSK